jgi:hypothetical protein
MLYIEVALHFSFLSIISYAVRNLVELVPFPLDGMFGFKHIEVKELTSGALFATLLFFLQTHLQEKLYYIVDRTFG